RPRDRSPPPEGVVQGAARHSSPGFADAGSSSAVLRGERGDDGGGRRLNGAGCCWAQKGALAGNGEIPAGRLPEHGLGSGLAGS
ncbi:hypothetical protein THAOC_25200, partial [Thalassiosira oceanica]